MLQPAPLEQPPLELGLTVHQESTLPKSRRNRAGFFVRYHPRRLIRTPRPVDSVLDLIGNTPMVRLSRIPGADDADIFVKMEFLNPGFLGSQAEFRRNFQTPIQAYSDKQAGQRLKRRGKSRWMEG